MKNAIIIAGFAGVGKSVLAKKYTNVVDLEIMDFKWDYNKSFENAEEKKGYREKSRKKDWPKNYFDAIISASIKYDIILISTDDEILDFLEEKEVDYVLAFPKSECKEEYLERYRKRGNTREFISRVDETFEELLIKLNSNDKKKLILNSNETLESKLLEITKNKKNQFPTFLEER